MSRRTLKLQRIPMEVRAQNTWAETIEKESIARLNFVKKEYSEDDLWFDRTKYRPRGQPIILSAPGLSNPGFIPNPDILQEKPDEICKLLLFKTEIISLIIFSKITAMRYGQTFESSIMQEDVKVVK